MLLDFARAINAQIVYPATSVVVKPNELESAIAKPLHKAHYEPKSSTAELAASLSYGIIKGHPFLDGNKRTAFFLANEYVRAQGLPGLADGVTLGEYMWMFTDWLNVILEWPVASWAWMLYWE